MRAIGAPLHRGIPKVAPEGTETMLKRRTSFVGREPETALLGEVLDAAESGDGALVIITGEAGIGKSALADEFARQAARRGHRALRGNCLPIDGVALDGLAHAFDRLTDADLTRIDASVLEQLGPLRPGRLSSATAGAGRPPGANRVAMIRAAEEVLRHFATDSPVAVILEDMHWADTSTIEVLDALARRLRDCAVTFVATVRVPSLRRNDDNSRLRELARIPGAHVLELTGLSAQHLAEVMRELLHRAPSRAVVDDVSERSLGNPLYARELAKSIARGDGGTSRQLRELFESTLDALPEKTRTLVRLCAFVGSPATPQLLARVADVPVEVVIERLEPARALDVVVWDPAANTFDVRHPLLSDAIIETAPAAHAHRAHSSIARALEQDPSLAGRSPAATIAHHWARSGDLDNALRASLDAAAEASAAESHSATLEHLERAIELWPRAADPEGRLGVSLGTVLCRAALPSELIGQNRHAVDLVRRAVSLNPAPTSELGDQYLLLAELLRRGYHSAFDADHALNRARALLTDAPPQLEARILIARSWHWDTDPAAAVVHGQRAIAIAEEERLAPLLSQALVQTGCARAMLGEVDAGIELALRGRSVADEAGFRIGSLTSHLPISAMLTHVGRPHDAVDEALAGLARTQDTGDEVVFRDALPGFAVSALLAAGRWDDARDVAVESSGDGRYSAVLPLSHAKLSALSGRWADAEAALASASELGAGHDPAHAIAASWLALLRGAPAVAERRATHALERREQRTAAATNELVFLAIAGRSAARAPLSPERASALLENLRTDHPGVAVLTPWSLSARAEAAAGDSIALWRQAHDAWQNVDGGHHMRIIAACRLADALGASSEAHALLDAALAQSQALDSPPLEQLTRATALRTSAPLAATGAATGARLTPREREVLALLATGRSNRLIGQRLGMSEKTASVHVSNLLRKLGVTSRTEAAVIAARGI